MGRKPCCSKEGLNKGAWTAMEDKILVSYIKTHGEGKWRGLPKRAGLKRCGKSCRLRWLNYLRPGIKRGNISEDEEDLILRLHNLLGNRWSLIAGRLPGRTDNEIKNYWNTNLGRRVDGRHSCQLSKPKPIANSKDKIPTTEPPMADASAPKAKTESNIIRTKAVKCTRAFFPQVQPMPPPVITNHQHAHSVLKESEGPPENLGGNYDSSNDLRMNLNAVGTSSGLEFLQAMGDPGIQIGSNTIGEDDIDINMVMYSDDLLSLVGFQSDIGLNLQSMASFQDSEEEWFQI